MEVNETGLRPTRGETNLIVTTDAPPSSLSERRRVAPESNHFDYVPMAHRGLYQDPSTDSG